MSISCCSNWGTTCRTAADALGPRSSALQLRKGTTMTSSTWAMMLGMRPGIALSAMPRFSRPDILFAVTVPEALHRARPCRSSRNGRSSGRGRGGAGGQPADSDAARLRTSVSPMAVVAGNVIVGLARGCGRTGGARHAAA